MVGLTSLWLAIVLAAVAVFLVSSVMHMLLPHHKSNYQQLPAEDELMAAMREKGVSPGNYMFPHCTSPSDMKSPETQAKWEKGPVGFVNVLPSGPPNMGKSLGQWFVYTIVVSVFVAYLAGRTLAPGTDYLRVFQVVGAAAFLGYGVGAVSESIWKGQKWSTSFKFVFDGFVYALFTAGVFGWLWPAA